MLIPILYRTDRFLICEKPRGLLSESPGLPDQLSLQENGRTLYPVHRLDQGTGGVMLLAFDPKTCSALQQLWSAASVTKEYLAVIPFWTGESEGIFQDLLFHDRYKNKSYVVQRSRKGVKPAECFWQHLQSVQTEVGSLSLMKIRLHTGRTHQIRVQFASRGFPLWGDQKYGSRFPDHDPALWAARLSFSDPFHSGSQVEAVSLPPLEEKPWSYFIWNRKHP